jgi:site-specific DNA recombinase
MPSTNGHGPKRAILYARVSTDEQARSGYSIPDQLGTLRAYAAEQGYEVKEECVDDGWSGADPDRPGLRRVMDLAQAGRAEVVVAIKRDRFFRSRLYRLLMDKDLEEHGVRLEALNDTGNRIGDGVQDDFAEWEREQITERTTAGRREKARQGKVIASRLPNYGFRFGPDRESYEVVEEEIVVVRRIFSELASRASVNSICTTLDADGVPPSGKGKKNWQRTFVRDCAFDDVYAPHTVEELKALGLSPKVCGELDPARLYGVWWYNRRETRTVRVPLRGGRYRKEKQIRKKPTAEWIPVPVPASGVPREAVVRARERLEGQAKCSCSDAFLGALRGRLALPRLRARAHRGLRVEGLHKEGRDTEEALPLRLCHSSPEREGGLLLLKDSERPQDRGRGMGSGEDGVARPGALGTRPRRLPRGREGKGRGGPGEGGSGIYEQDRRG